MSKLVNAIYKAPITVRKTERSVTVSIKYNNKVYTGSSFCHPEDQDFFSSKVGYSIAKSRAIIKIMKYEMKNLTAETRWKKQFCKEVEATTQMKNNLMSAEARLRALKNAMKCEESMLRDYITTIETTITSVRKMREWDKSN